MKGNEMSKHTPGPWVATDKIVHLPDFAESGRIAIVINDPEFPERSLANARLIAAAPDLLSALTMVLAASHGRGQDGKQAMEIALDAARAAIAKATGE